MNIDCVLFDLDGTLLDTAPEFAVAVNRLRAEHQLPAMDYAPIRATVSDGARALTRLALDIEEEHPSFQAARLRLLAIYEEDLGAHSAPFPGIPELLLALAERGIRWGIVTNKPSHYAEPLMRRIVLEPTSSTLVCPDHVGMPKPAPEPLWHACQQVGVAPGRTLYVGDHRRDIEAARNAGMPSAAAGWGYIHPDDPLENWGADLVADDAHALAQLIFRQI